MSSEINQTSEDTTSRERVQHNGRLELAAEVGDWAIAGARKSQAETDADTRYELIVQSADQMESIGPLVS